MFSVHSRKARKDENPQMNERTDTAGNEKCCEHPCGSNQPVPDLSAANTKANNTTASQFSSNQQNSLIKPHKDIWDKIGAIAPIVSGILIFGAGWLFTYAYNEQQLRLQEVQTIERFIPHLMGSEQSKKAAILAISSLTNPELAARFASIFASSGTVSALQSIAEQGDQHERKVATKALAIALENLEIRDSKISDLENAYKSLQDKSNEPSQTSTLPPVQLSEGLTPARLDKLAQAYKAIGQFANAEPLLKESLSIREKAYGPVNPEVAASARRLADLYQVMGNTDLADAMYKKAKDIENKVAEKATPIPSSTPSNTSDSSYSPENKKDQQVDQKEQKGEGNSIEKESMLNSEPVEDG